MTKLDLVSGMMVELRNGDKCLVLDMNFKDGIKKLLMCCDGFLYLDDYNYNLEFNAANPLTGKQVYDIVKIYDTIGLYGCGFAMTNRPDRYKVIWQRSESVPEIPQVKVFTKQEIAEKLNMNVNDFIIE